MKEASFLNMGAPKNFFFPLPPCKTRLSSNKEPLSLPVDDQACDVSHGRVAGYANVLSAGGEKQSDMKGQTDFQHRGFITGLQDNR